MKVLGDLIPPKLTTAERNALTGVSGAIIFNTTTNALEVYNGSSWQEANGDGLTFADVWAANTLMNC